jgi:hypothetical protein
MVPIVQEAGWASELVWKEKPEEKSFAGDRTKVVQSELPLLVSSKF